VYYELWRPAALYILICAITCAAIVTRVVAIIRVV
jgi:hypothetical protein